MSRISSLQPEQHQLECLNCLTLACKPVEVSWTFAISSFMRFIPLCRIQFKGENIFLFFNIGNKSSVIAKKKIKRSKGYSTRNKKLCAGWTIQGTPTSRSIKQSSLKQILIDPQWFLRSSNKWQFCSIQTIHIKQLGTKFQLSDLYFPS